MRIFLFITLAFFSFQAFADEKARPGPHNKIGHTKQSEEDKKETFFYKLFNNELDIMGSNTNNQSAHEGNDQILSQIEKLADMKDRGIITEAEFNDKKAILLDKIE
tara:strand:+ start:160 stop:477 length:318 start_codon:yes stop_codon:yes gene_type:complete